jgi:Uma2 family endonuclease
MTTVITPMSSVGMSPRLLTVADLPMFPTQLPSGPVRYELDDGRLVVMAPPGYDHGAVELNIGTELKVQGERKGHGKASSGEVAVILRRGPDRVVGADAVFVASKSLPIRRSSEGYLETIPDLVVEVRSPNDTGPEVEQKVRDYLRAGVKVVWVADPEARTVTAHRPGQPPFVFSETDTLTVGDVIPGFRVAVRDVFQL